MTGRALREGLLTAAFFSALGLFFSRPIFLVSDFWWHLANGEWILRNRALPEIDPFSLLPHSGTLTVLRETLILKGYWLAQLLFAQVHELAGMGGAVALKAIILTSIVFSVWRLLLLRGVPHPWALLLLIPLAVYLREYDELRPHLLSFLFFAVLMLLLERYRQGLQSGTHHGWRREAAIVALMALWANVHPGFIVGSGLVGLTLLDGIIRFFKGWQALAADRLRRLCLTGVAALLAPRLNPNGFLVYKVLQQEGLSGEATLTVTEFDPVWIYFPRLGESYWLYLLLVLLAVSLVCCRVNRRKAPLLESLLLLAFAVVGFLQFRYSIFFVIVTTVVVGRCLTEFPALRGREAPLGWASVLVGAVSFVLFSFTQSAVARGPLALGSVDKSVAFVKEQLLPGPLFSPYEWGGYLQWTLSPEYKLFIDPRAINYRHYADYREVTQGRKARVFAQYGFNTVVFYLYPPNLEQIPSLIFSLLRDDAWRLRYAEGGVMIFVRTAADRNRDALDKGRFMAALAATLTEKSRLAPGRAEYLLDLGQLRYIQGDVAGARAYFIEALRRDPRNEFATAWLKHLDGG